MAFADLPASSKDASGTKGLAFVPANFVTCEQNVDVGHPPIHGENGDVFYSMVSGCPGTYPWWLSPSAKQTELLESMCSQTVQPCAQSWLNFGGRRRRNRRSGARISGGVGVTNSGHGWCCESERLEEMGQEATTHKDQQPLRNHSGKPI